jgi:hypothetical protein
MGSSENAGAELHWFVEVDGARHTAEAESPLRVQMHRAPDGDAERIDLTIRNESQAPIAIDRAGVSLPDPVDAGEWRVFLDGGTLAWAGVRRLGDPCDPNSLHATSDSRRVGHRSSMLTALADPAGGRALLVGFLGQRHGLNFVDLWPEEDGRRASAIEAWQEFAPQPLGGEDARRILQPDRELELDSILVRRDEDPLALLEDFGRRVQAHHGRTFDEPPIVGLMTWYAQMSAIDEEIVTGNLPIVATLFEGYPQPMRKVLILDHGWQAGASLGPTTADPARFPRGLAWLSAEVQRFGLEMGLWLSTTNVTKDAVNFAELEPLLATDAGGEPLEGEICVWGQLPGDGPTRPTFPPDAAREETRGWWRKQIRELAELGVRYFKLDFFALRTSEPDRAAAATGELVDGAFEAFRSACPPETHLAPCSCDTNLQLGRCDSVRIGSDIGNAGSWPAGVEHFRASLSSIGALWFKQRRFWVNDPDSAQVDKGCPLGEARVRATAAAFSGGHFMAGEDLRLASAERIEMLRRMLPAYPVAARPLDLFEAPFPDGYPAIWSLPVGFDGRPTTAIALFNLDGTPRRFEVDAALFRIDPATPFAAYEWWQMRFLGTHAGRVGVEVPAGDVAILHAAPVAAHPALVSVSHHHTPWHIVESCRWDESAQALTGTLHTKAGLPVTLFGHAPADWTLATGGRFAGSGGRAGNWQYVVRTTGHRTAFSVPFAPA